MRQRGSFPAARCKKPHAMPEMRVCPAADTRAVRGSMAGIPAVDSQSWKRSPHEVYPLKDCCAVNAGKTTTVYYSVCVPHVNAVQRVLCDFPCPIEYCQSSEP